MLWRNHDHGGIFSAVSERPKTIDVFAETMTDRPAETVIAGSTRGPIFEDLAGRRMAHYRVVAPLRAGGMGTVWRARDESLERPVALKVLTRELSREPTLVERFRREARSQARLSHGNVVPIYYIGESDGLMFFAMELIEGQSLADLIDRGQRLPWRRAVELMVGVGRALRHAHQRGLIHRDIKPGNLLLDETGHLKVADFGLALPMDADGRKLTGKGVFLGTPWYCSPEQARAHDLDHRSDMYAMGACFYHMVMGRPLFDGKTPFEILAKHAADPPDLSDLRARVPSGVADVFARLLAKHPDDRYVDHDVVVQTLKGFRMEESASNWGTLDADSHGDDQ